jgi:hypothetical protein
MCALVAIALGALATVACDHSPCAQDVAGCGEGEGFSFDASCEADGPLSVQLLELQTGEPIPAGRWPELHHGSQGGVHFALAVAVQGLEPGFMNVQLNLDAADCSGSDCAAMDELAERTVDTDDSMWEIEGNEAMLRDVILVLDHEPADAGELRIDAVDPCGRVAEYVHPAG